MSESSTISPSHASARVRETSKAALQPTAAGTSETTASQTLSAPEQPAAIVSKTLARFSAGQRSSNEYRKLTNPKPDSGLHRDDPSVSTDPQPRLSEPLLGQHSGDNTDYIMAHVQAQFRAQAEMAVLAQANQMPNDAMPFSMGV